jgi:hypothetical protein
LSTQISAIRGLVSEQANPAVRIRAAVSTVRMDISFFEERALVHFRNGIREEVMKIPIRPERQT